MKYSLLKLRDALSFNFWSIPFTLAIISFCLSLILNHSFLNYGNLWVDLNLITIELDSAQIILSTIAGSVITTTGVVFSITVVTLTLAMSQLGPRLLPNFMRQGKTQITLGIFIGTFIYCLISLSALGGEIVPTIAVLFGMGLGILSFLTLIYFINSIVNMIQLDNILNYIDSEIKKMINREFVNKEEKFELANDHQLERNFNEFNDIDFPYSAHGQCQKNGYIQTINYKKIFNYALEHDLYIEIHKRSGHYILSNYPILTLYSKHTEINQKHIKTIMSYISLGEMRTIIQDIEFGFEQIVEIAVRAMSPGVNEPFTAVHCLNVLTEGLIYLNHYIIPPNYYIDKDNHIRVIFNQTNYESILDTAFDRFRQDAIFDLTVGIRLLDVIIQLLEFNLNIKFAKELVKQSQMIFEGVINKKLSHEDYNKVVKRYQKIISMQK